MVEVERRYRDVLRFLWFGNQQSENPNIVKTVHQKRPQVVATFLHFIYVDDLTTGASNVELGYEFYLKAKLQLAEAGFNHRKFVSNSTDLTGRILVNEGLSTEAHTSNTLALEHKVLGVTWKPLDDQLWFDITEVNEYLKTIQLPKRNVVGVAAKIYDPLGILSPLTVVFKVFFQRLCK
uniref:Reverse transcriptase domain-containing protein n=1 Tax=Amphimedon queenslandica TaxID=400682 RepID=A0A1X7V227_AMPQE